MAGKGDNDFYVKFGSNATDWAKGLSAELQPANGAIGSMVNLLVDLDQTSALVENRVGGRLKNLVAEANKAVEALDKVSKGGGGKGGGGTGGGGGGADTSGLARDLAEYNDQLGAVFQSVAAFGKAIDKQRRQLEELAGITSKAARKIKNSERGKNRRDLDDQLIDPQTKRTTTREKTPDAITRRENRERQLAQISGDDKKRKIRDVDAGTISAAAVDRIVSQVKRGVSATKDVEKAVNRLSGRIKDGITVSGQVQTTGGKRKIADVTQDDVREGAKKRREKAVEVDAETFARFLESQGGKVKKSKKKATDVEVKAAAEAAVDAEKSASRLNASSKKYRKAIDRVAGELSAPQFGEETRKTLKGLGFGRGIFDEANAQKLTADQKRRLAKNNPDLAAAQRSGDLELTQAVRNDTVRDAGGIVNKRLSALARRIATTADEYRDNENAIAGLKGSIERQEVAGKELAVAQAEVARREKARARLLKQIDDLRQSRSETAAETSNRRYRANRREASAIRELPEVDASTKADLQRQRDLLNLGANEALLRSKVYSERAQEARGVEVDSSGNALVGKGRGVASNSNRTGFGRGPDFLTTAQLKDIATAFVKEGYPQAAFTKSTSKKELYEGIVAAGRAYNASGRDTVTDFRTGRVKDGATFSAIAVKLLNSATTLERVLKNAPDTKALSATLKTGGRSPFDPARGQLELGGAIGPKELGFEHSADDIRQLTKDLKTQRDAVRKAAITDVVAARAKDPNFDPFDFDPNEPNVVGRGKKAKVARAQIRGLQEGSNVVDSLVTAFATLNRAKSNVDRLKRQADLQPTKKVLRQLRQAEDRYFELQDTFGDLEKAARGLGFTKKGIKSLQTPEAIQGVLARQNSRMLREAYAENQARDADARNQSYKAQLAASGQALFGAQTFTDASGNSRDFVRRNFPGLTVNQQGTRIRYDEGIVPKEGRTPADQKRERLINSAAQRYSSAMARLELASKQGGATESELTQMRGKVTKALRSLLSQYTSSVAGRGRGLPGLAGFIPGAEGGAGIPALQQFLPEKVGFGAEDYKTFAPIFSRAKKARDEQDLIASRTGVRTREEVLGPQAELIQGLQKQRDAVQKRLDKARAKETAASEAYEAAIAKNLKSLSKADQAILKKAEADNEAAAAEREALRATRKNTFGPRPIEGGKPNLELGNLLETDRAQVERNLSEGFQKQGLNKSQAAKKTGDFLRQYANAVEALGQATKPSEIRRLKKVVDGFRAQLRSTSRDERGNFLDPRLRDNAGRDVFSYRRFNGLNNELVRTSERVGVSRNEASNAKVNEKLAALDTEVDNRKALIKSLQGQAVTEEKAAKKAREKAQAIQAELDAIVKGRRVYSRGADGSLGRGKQSGGLENAETRLADEVRRRSATRLGIAVAEEARARAAVERANNKANQQALKTAEFRLKKAQQEFIRINGTKEVREGKYTYLDEAGNRQSLRTDAAGNAAKRSSGLTNRQIVDEILAEYKDGYTRRQAPDALKRERGDIQRQGNYSKVAVEELRAEAEAARAASDKISKRKKATEEEKRAALNAAQNAEKELAAAEFRKRRLAEIRQQLAQIAADDKAAAEGQKRAVGKKKKAAKAEEQAADGELAAAQARVAGLREELAAAKDKKSRQSLRGKLGYATRQLNALLSEEDQLAAGANSGGGKKGGGGSGRASGGGAASGPGGSNILQQILRAVRDCHSVLKNGVRITERTPAAPKEPRAPREPKEPVEQKTAVQRAVERGERPVERFTARDRQVLARTPVVKDLVPDLLRRGKAEAEVAKAVKLVTNGVLSRAEAESFFIDKMKYGAAASKTFVESLKAELNTHQISKRANDAQASSDKKAADEAVANAKREASVKAATAAEREKQARKRAVENVRLAETEKLVTQATRDQFAALRGMSEGPAKVEAMVRAYRALNNELRQQGFKAGQVKGAAQDLFANAGVKQNASQLGDIARAATGGIGAGIASRAKQDAETVDREYESAFNSVLFGGKGFMGRVVNSIGTFIVRNFSAGLVFGLTNALQEVLQQALQAETTFVRVSHALESTGREVGSLRKDLTNISAEYGVSLADTYDTAAGLVGLFDSTTEIAGATKVVSQLQLISDGALNAAEAMGVLASVSSAYGLDFQEQFGGDKLAAVEHVADVLTTVQNELGVGVEQVGEGVARFSGLAAQLGISFEEAAVYVGQVAKLTNQTGAAAGEQLSRILGSLQTGRGRGAAIDAFGAQGIEQAFNDNDYGRVLQIMSSNFEGLTASQQRNLSVTIAGQRQAAAFAGLMHDGEKALNAIRKATYDKGSADERAQKILETLTKQIATFRTNMQALASGVLQTGIFDAFGAGLKVANLVLRSVNNALAEFNDLTDEGPLNWIKRMIFGLGGLAVALTLVRRAAGGLTAAVRGSATGSNFIAGATQPRQSVTSLFTGPRLQQQRPGFGSFAPNSGSLFARSAGFGYDRLVRQPAQFIGGTPGYRTAFQGPLTPEQSESRAGRLRTQAFGYAAQASDIRRVEEQRAQAGLRASRSAEFHARRLDFQAAASERAARTANRLGGSMGNLSKSGAALDAAFLVVGLAITSLITAANKANAIGDAGESTYSRLFGDGKGKTKDQRDREAFIGESNEAIKRNQPSNLEAGFGALFTVGKSALTGRNPYDELKRSFGVEDIGQGYGFADTQGQANKFLTDLERQDTGRGLQDVQERANDAMKKAADGYKKAYDEGDISKQQFGQAMAYLEQLNILVQDQTADALALQAGVTRISSDQSKNISSLITALGGTGGDAVGGVNIQQYSEELRKNTGVSRGDNSELAAALDAFQKGGLDDVGVLVNQRKALRGTLEGLLVTYQTQVEADPDSAADTKAEIDNVIGQLRQSSTQLAEALVARAGEIGDAALAGGRYGQASKAYRNAASRILGQQRDRQAGNDAAYLEKLRNSRGFQQSLEGLGSQKLPENKNDTKEEKQRERRENKLIRDAIQNDIQTQIERIRRHYAELIAKAGGAAARAALQAAQAEKIGGVYDKALADPDFGSFVDQGAAGQARADALETARQNRVSANDKLTAQMGANLSKYNANLKEGQTQQKAAQGAIIYNEADAAQAQTAIALQNLVFAKAEYGKNSIEYANALLAYEQSLRSQVELADQQAAAKDQAGVAAIAQGNAVGVAQGNLSAARNAVNRAKKYGTNSTQYQGALAQLYSAQQGVTSATNAVAVAQAQLAQAYGDARGDAVAAARSGVAVARAQLSAALAASGGARSAEVIGAQAALVAANAQVGRAQSDLVASRYQVLVAMADAAGHTVQSAVFALRGARAALRLALKRSGGEFTAEVNQARAQAIQAKAGLRDARLQDDLDTIDFNLQMGRITQSSAIAALREILRTRDLTKAQRRQLLLQIKGMQDELSQSPFNFGDIKLPTPYQVRRYIAAQRGANQSAMNEYLGASAAAARATGGGSVYNDSRTVNFIVNGGNAREVKQAIREALAGSGRTMTTQPRRRT